MKLNGFDANQQEEFREFSPLPEGKYLAIITNSEEKQNAKQTGTYLELTFQIVEGQYSKRQLFARLNLDNPSAEAVKIAKCELGAICKAVNVPTPKDSSELHDLPLKLSVKLEDRKDKPGEKSNRIVGYYSKNHVFQESNVATASGPSASLATAGATAGSEKAPWQR